MVSKDKNIELIERYLDGGLTAEELEAFEKLKAEDPEFRERVEEMSVMVDCIKSSARDSLLSELKELEESLPEVAIEKNGSKGSGLRLIKGGKGSGRRIFLAVIQTVGAAACLTGCYFGIGEPLIQSSRIPDYQRNVIIPASKIREGTGERGNIDTAEAGDQAFIYYRNQKYQKAISVLNDAEGKIDEDWLVLGNSYYAKKKFKQAAECFQTQNFPPESKHADVAKFWLAKCYLALKNDEEAKSLLVELVSGNGRYSFDAGNLLEAIN